MKCILISRFGASNIGDLAISNYIHKRLDEKFDVDIYNFTGGAQSIKDVDNVISNRELMIKREKFKRTLSNLKLDKVLSLGSKVRNLTKKKDDSVKVGFSDIVKNYDVAVIAGGNMLMGLTAQSNSIKFFSDHVRDANQAKVPVFVLDIGIGPFYTDAQAKLAVEALNACEAITFRDDQSYNLFKIHGGNTAKARVSVDPVFLLENNRDREIGSDVNIGVNIFDASLIGYNKKDYNKSIESYALLINDLINKHNYTVSLFTTTLIDELTLELVANKVDNREKLEVVAVNGISDLIDLYGNLDALVGTRMHSIIIAFSQELPFVGLSWQPKVNAMFEIIEEENYLYNLNNFGENVNQIIEKINQRLNNIDAEKVKMQSKRKEIAEMSRVNDTILDKFILEKTSLKK